MKNRRTIAFSAVSLVLLSIVGLAILRWYQAGELPAGPADFLNLNELERTRARLAAHRLDLQPAMDLCDDVRDHLLRAGEVRFTNPDRAAEHLRELSADLDRIDASHRETVVEMETGHPQTWQTPFQDFLKQSARDYEDARGLCRTLSRKDWEDTAFPALLNEITKAKDISSRLQQGPVFREATELRTSLYPLFEQAYSSRNETDPERIRRALFRAQPALTRWFYARLYQARHSLPPNLCPASLYAYRDALNTLAEELAIIDVTGDIASWTFPQGRAQLIDQFADLTAPLAKAQTLRDWSRMVASRQLDWLAFLEASAPDAETPDPELRSAAQWILTASQIVDRQCAALAASPTTDRAAVLASALDRMLRAHPEFGDCVARCWAQAGQLHQRLQDAHGHLLGQPIASASDMIDAAAGFQAAASDFARGVGEPIESGLVHDGLDQWFVLAWPGVRDLGSLANGIQLLERSAIVSVPGLQDAAALLEDMATSQTDAEHAALITKWTHGLSDALTPFPLLSRQIERSLDSLDHITLQEDLREAIVLKDDREIRTLAAQIAVTEDAPPELRSASRIALAILDLPQRIHELDPGRLDAGTAILPPAPDSQSIVYPLYAARIAPILGVAEDLRRLEGEDCGEALAAMAANLRSVNALYPHWHGLDATVESATLATLPACATIDSPHLGLIAEGTEELAGQFESIAPWHERVTRLLALAETPPHRLSFPNGWRRWKPITPPMQGRRPISKPHGGWWISGTIPRPSPRSITCCKRYPSCAMPPRHLAW